MNNYQLACTAVSNVLNVDIHLQETEISHPALERSIWDTAVFINGKKTAYIGWREYHGCSAKVAYYGLHSLCREWILYNKEKQCA